jgi:hypothetical protein
MWVANWESSLEARLNHQAVAAIPIINRKMPTTNAGAAGDFFGGLMRVWTNYFEIAKSNTLTARATARDLEPAVSDQNPSFEDEGGRSSESNIIEASLAIGLERNTQFISALHLDADG